MHKLSCVVMDNVGGLDHLLVDFDPSLTVIIGPSGSGKSSLLWGASWALERMLYTRSDDSSVGVSVRRVRNGAAGLEIWVRCVIDVDSTRKMWDGRLTYTRERQTTAVHVAPYAVSELPELLQVSCYLPDELQQGDVFFDTVPDEGSDARERVVQAIRLLFPDLVLDDESWAAGPKSKLGAITALRDRVNRIRLDQLSNGEFGALSLVFSILMKDKLEYDRPCSRTVFIHDIETYMGPALQRRLLRTLLEMFPDHQFVITTNSPVIVGEVPAHQVRRLYVDPEKGGTWICGTPSHARGLRMDVVLEDLFGVPARNEEVQRQVKALHALAAESNMSGAQLEHALEEFKALVGPTDSDAVNVTTGMAFKAKLKQNQVTKPKERAKPDAQFWEEVVDAKFAELQDQLAKGNNAGLKDALEDIIQLLREPLTCELDAYTGETLQHMMEKVKIYLFQLTNLYSKCSDTPDVQQMIQEAVHKLAEYTEGNRA